VTRQRAAKGHRKVTAYPSPPAFLLLEREAKKRRVSADRVLTRSLEIWAAKVSMRAALTRSFPRAGPARRKSGSRYRTRRIG
jgi:hypothetical protein